MRLTAATPVVLWAIVLTVFPLRAGEVLLSFVNAPESRGDTLRILGESGVRSPALESFSRALDDYYAEPLRIEMQGWPTGNAGVYRFQSMQEAVRAIPKPLCEVDHAWGVNCFDSVIMVLTGRLEIGLTPNNLDGPFFAIVNGPERLSILPTAPPGDAFSLANPEWYRELSKKYFANKDDFERRVCFTSALFTSYPLPIATDANNLSEAALSVLGARWKRYGLKVADRNKIVLGHEVNLPGRFFVTGHAGLLVPNKQGWTYIEKAGGAGPFVRLDVKHPVELLEWYKELYPNPRNGYTHFLMSFNDDEMFIARPAQLQTRPEETAIRLP